MPALGRYDGALHMFVEEVREADIAHLRFLRWLARRRSLDHGTAGPAGGEQGIGSVRPMPKPASRDGKEAGDK